MRKRELEPTAAALCLLLILNSLESSLYGQEKKQGTKQDVCTVQIVKPNAGEKVGADVLVEGTATIKTGSFLWVFAHRKGLAIWWPQGSGAAQIKNGEWAVLASIGGPQDRGSSFEIMAVVVDAATDNSLNGWVRKTEETGTYPGIRLPAVLEGCGAPPEVTVTKTN